MRMRSIDGPAGRRGGAKGAAVAQRMPRDLTSVKAWRIGQVTGIYWRELCIKNIKCKGLCGGWVGLGPVVGVMGEPRETRFQEMGTVSWSLCKV